MKPALTILPAEILALALEERPQQMACVMALAKRVPGVSEWRIDDYFRLSGAVGCLDVHISARFATHPHDHEVEFSIWHRQPKQRIVGVSPNLRHRRNVTKVDFRVGSALEKGTLEQCVDEWVRRWQEFHLPVQQDMMAMFRYKVRP